MTATIPFNRPFATGGEAARVQEALASGWTGGNGPFSRRCQELLTNLTGTAGVLMTHSCTGALEMAALLAGVGPGDEVIMPSFTFVSTANAFALRGATPVFVDVDPDTMLLDEALAAEAVTSRTRVIAPVHYGGACGDMAAIAALADQHDLLVIEDAAQAIGATWQGRALGALGDMGALSFHETKNLSCGEGGALLLGDERWVARAEVLHEKGTNRAGFARGEVDKYTWVDLGSSFLMSDVTAAFLLEQLGALEQITAARLAIWDAYHAALAPAEQRGLLRRPVVRADVAHNAHLYYVLARDRAARDAAIAALREHDVHAYFHYVPLHSSPAGRRLGRAHGELPHTKQGADRLLRLPLWVGMSDGDVERVAGALVAALEAA